LEVAVLTAHGQWANDSSSSDGYRLTHPLVYSASVML